MARGGARVRREHGRGRGRGRARGRAAPLRVRGAARLRLLRCGGGGRRHRARARDRLGLGERERAARGRARAAKAEEVAVRGDDARRVGARAAADGAHAQRAPAAAARGELTLEHATQRGLVARAGARERVAEYRVDELAAQRELARVVLALELAPAERDADRVRHARERRRARARLVGARGLAAAALLAARRLRAAYHRGGARFESRAAVEHELSHVRGHCDIVDGKQRVHARGRFGLTRAASRGHFQSGRHFRTV